jgi:hypothetical protein
VVKDKEMLWLQPGAGVRSTAGSVTEKPTFVFFEPTQQTTNGWPGPRSDTA